MSTCKEHPHQHVHVPDKDPNTNDSPGGYEGGGFRFLRSPPTWPTGGGHNFDNFSKLGFMISEFLHRNQIHHNMK